MGLCQEVYNKKVLEHFQQNGKIVTIDEGVYEDIKEALLREGYEFDTNFQLGYYTISISWTKKETDWFLFLNVYIRIFLYVYKRW